MGRDSFDVFSLGTGVAANVNEMNFARGLYAQLDPNNVGRPIVGIVPHQLLPGVRDGQVARWDSSTGYWEASEAPEGTASVNETLVDGVAFTFQGDDNSASTWFSLSRRLREADRGRVLLTDALLIGAPNDSRSPFPPVLADYLIDLPRTPWPGPDSNVSSGSFVQLHAPVGGGRTAGQAANMNLYYTGTVVTDITANLTDSQGTVGVTSVADLNVGEILYINFEAMQVFSIDPGTSSIGVFRAQNGTTATTHDSGDWLQRDDGLGWFFANTITNQNGVPDLRMTLLGGLINSETQPAFARDILYEDASPRDTSGLESGLKFDLQLSRAPVAGSEMHIDFVVTRTVSGDDYEVRYSVEPFSSDTWLALDPNAFGGSSAHQYAGNAHCCSSKRWWCYQHHPG